MLSSRLIVGSEMPDAALRSTCDQRKSARAALTCSIDTFGIDIEIPEVLILKVLLKVSCAVTGISTTEKISCPMCMVHRQ